MCFLWREWPCALGANPATRHGVDRVDRVGPHPGAGASRFAVRSIWCSLKRSQSWETSVWPRTDGTDVNRPVNRPPQPRPRCAVERRPPLLTQNDEVWNTIHQFWMPNHDISWHNESYRFWFPRKVQTPHFMAPEVAKQSLGHRMDMLQTRHV